MGNDSKRFVEGELLGVGGFGRVFRAHDRELAIDVALKRLHPEASSFGESLTREFRVLAHFTHPHVVTLHELHEDERGMFLTMELVPDDRLAAQVGPWPESIVRAVFGQAASALQSLHAAGLVHGDVKPGNVLHTAEGRTVLTDFGLASTIGNAVPQGLSLAYAAPELFEGQAPSASTDAYALGVMLHDALSHAPAFDTRYGVTALTKEQTPPLQPESGSDDLRALVARLTRRNPRERPAVADATSILGAQSSNLMRPWLHRTTPVIGRDAELARLTALAAMALEGTRSVVILSGPAGIGKTAVLDAFSERMDARVVRVFPNERLIGGLNDDLAKLGEVLPTVVCIDDLHLCEPHGLVALVEALQRVPKGRGALVVATLRADNSVEQELLGLLRDTRVATSVTRLALAPLARQVSLELASRACDRPIDTAEAERIVARAGGNPLALSLSGERGLDEVLQALPEPARKVLSLVAASRSPLPVGVLMHAAGIDSAAYLVELQRLRIARLVTTSVQSGAGAEIGVAHQTISDAIGAPPREIYLSLAEAFLAASGQRSDNLRAGAALAFAAAGDNKRAREHAIATANQAGQVGDVERETRMLSLAIETGISDPADWRVIARRLATCLVAVRRLREAGRLLLKLAATAGSAEEVAELEQQALEAMLFGAELEGARALLTTALRSIGMSVPKRLVSTVLPILFFYRTPTARRLPAKKPDAKLGASNSLRVLHSASLGFAMFDPLVSAYFQVAHIKAALRTEDAAGLVRALAIHLVHSATSFIDPERLAVAEARIERALPLVPEPVRADVEVLVNSARAAAAWVLGDLATAKAASAKASRAAMSRTGLTWEADSSLLIRCAVAEEAGDWSNLATWVDEGMANALLRGDRYLQLNLRGRPLSFLRLVAGEPDEGVEAAEWACSQWPGPPGLLGLYVYLARVRRALYRGDPELAVNEAETGLAPLARAFLLQSHYHAGWIHFARIQAALQLATATQGRQRAREMARAAKLAKKVSRSCSLTQARAAGALMQLAHGDEPRAAETFEGVGLAGLGTLVRAANGDARAHTQLMALGVHDPKLLARALVYPGSR